MAIGERYERLLGAAETVIARRGFHHASIREIARAAGLSLAGLFERGTPADTSAGEAAEAPAGARRVAGPALRRPA